MKFYQISYFLKGALVVIAPLNFHFEETINIFKLLFVEREKFYIYLGLIENFKIHNIPFHYFEMVDYEKLNELYNLLDIGTFLFTVTPSESI